ncbi:filamentous hemagglutinin N-terminal domain-containing protein, partial [Rhizobium sp. 2YAF20]|uniref:two-partner secretion domain-containing protein n=1 Tax=Rhizobium sp. 2YAF20 TaxID=3233027 RepID=UPI003F9E7F68
MGKHPKQQSGNAIHRLVRFGQQSLAVILSALLLLQPAIANAQSVSASTTAPAANQPGIGAAPNGVPLIDIVTPNAAGLSHNKFSDFNVGTPGLILNNYKGEVGTSNLGGVTPGNPNLNNSNPASVILNEVTSGNRSALNGPTEVFGGRADVVIANPNGITCSGCGFINTPHATLTTGVPDIGADGSLTGFTVNGGDVTFEGAGGNFASGPGAVDLFDVVSRNIHVNAPIYGKTLRLTGGASKYDYATGEATALTATSGTPEYAIDGSALGAMQADRIKIVVTEKGAGVNMAGDMAANAGELSLSADGKISIGNVSGSQGVSIASKSKVTAAKVTSRSKVSVAADQGITLQSVAADDDIVLSSGSGLLSVAADVNSAANLQLSSAAGIAAGSVTAGSGAATLSTSSGDIRITGAANSHGALTITATSGSISAASLLSYNNIGLTAGLDIAVSGNVFAEGNLTATGRSISTGMVVAGLGIAATQADPNGNTILANGGDLQLTATGGAINATNLLSSGKTSLDAATLTAQSLTAHGTIDINATTSLSGQILGGRDISLAGAGIQAGAIISGVDFAGTEAAGGSIVQTASGDIALYASGIATVDSLNAAGSLTVQATDLQSKDITSHAATAIQGSLDVDGQVLSAGNLSVTGGNHVAAGGLISGVDFAATDAAGGNIILGQTGDMTVAAAGTIDASTILAAGDLFVTGSAISGDTITGHKDTTLSGATTVSGQILGAGNVSVTGPSIAADAIVSGVDIDATNAAGGSIVLGPATTGTADLSLAATAGLDVGTLLSAGALSATGATITADSVTAHGDLALDGATTVSGQVLGSGNVLITGQSVSAQTLVAGIDFNATNASGGNIVLSPGGDLKVSVSGAAAASTIQAAGTIDASAATIAADAITGHKDIALSGASGGVDVNGQILGANDISLSGSSINAGAVVSGVDFTATAAAGGNIVQTSSGDVSLTSTGNVTIGTLLSAGDLTAQAAGFKADDITSHGDVDLKASLDVGGHVLSAGNLSVEGASLNAGLLASGVDLAATDAAGGNIVLSSSGAMNLTATGNIAAGTILSAGDVTAKAANLAADSITSHGKVDVIGNVDVTNQIIAAGNLTLSGGSISAPVLISGVDFAATNANSGNIVLAPSGDMALTASADISAQTILSAGTLAATAADINAASVTSHGDITLAAGNGVAVTNQILAANNVSLSGQTVNAHQVITGVDFAATAQSPSGALALGPSGDLTINATSAVTDTLIVAGNLSVTYGDRGDVVASAFTAGNITSHGTVGIGSTARPGAVKINGQLLGASDVSITGSDISGNVVVAGVDFAATNQSATGDVILGQVGDLTLSATAGDISANSLLAAGTITANATNNVNANAVAQGDLTIGAGNAITLSG